MPHTEWRGTGSKYSLSWVGQSWTLELNRDRPGIRRQGDAGFAFLSLAGVAMRGRWEPLALSGRSLIRVERVRSRIEATYAPEDWGGLEVRASWDAPSEQTGIDLEIQVTASSVDRLTALEVFVVTGQAETGDPCGRPEGSLVVTPRDRGSAGLTYDGRERESDLCALTTLPIPAPGAPRVPFVRLGSPWPDLPGSPCEAAHPEDTARRVLFWPGGQSPASAPPAATRCALFGHDLEKGVVIRGRLRGFWLPVNAVDEVAHRAVREFLELPPPLGR